MQFELPFGPFRLRPRDEHRLVVGTQSVRLWLVRNRRARRYVLRLRPDGSARVTIPRGGSEAEARRFTQKHIGWLEKQLLRQAALPVIPRAWLDGAEILFRGERRRLEAGLDGEAGLLRFGTECIRVMNASGDLRPEIERHLWRLAARELPPRVLELAAMHQLPVQRVAVRNQRSRWGSCSRRGTISLNWRLVQAPSFVRDYIILHELAHLREMNHSRRFWREVERLCPEFGPAEAWLKAHGELLR
ncbi:MAG TPA: SprT family zinc-dependent metalloprotease [Candidatus Binatia bacterium]|jgi:predicted metal-dependent hydrolase|nr:SprT family zinc-dependent metalloprotease [Candidatus Binatia bacterium]